jgi:hypothetical protein
MNCGNNKIIITDLGVLRFEFVIFFTFSHYTHFIVSFDLGTSKQKQFRAKEIRRKTTPLCSIHTAIFFHLPL